MRAKVHSESERGSALLLVMIMTVTLLGTLSLMIEATVTQSQTTMARSNLRSALNAADNGMARAKVFIMAELAVPTLTPALETTGAPSLTPVVLWTAVDNTDAQATYLGDDGATAFYSINVLGTVGGHSRMVVSVMGFEPGGIPLVLDSAPAAVVALGNVVLDDAVSISGNDHTSAGVLELVPMPGLIAFVAALLGLPPVATSHLGNGSSGWAINAGGTITDNTGGGATAAGRALNFAWDAWPPDQWTDTSVSDSTIGGQAIKASSTYFPTTKPTPANAGALFGFTTNAELRAKAEADGTLFAVGVDDPSTPSVDVLSAGNEASACASWCNNGSNDASGKVIYLEVPNGTDISTHMRLPRTAGTEGCVFVLAGVNPNVHDVTNSGDHFHAERSPFKGVLIMDGGNVKLKTSGIYVGQIFSFGDLTFLNEAGPAVYSSTLLASELPSVPAGSDYEVTAETWKELPAPAGAVGTW